MTGEGRLHILELYHDCGPGGAEQIVLDLSCLLRTQGHRVTVATWSGGWMAERLHDRGIETHVFPKRQGPVDLRALFAIWRLARERRVDVIHAHEFPMIIGLAPFAVLQKFPLVATVHGREILAARRRRRLALRLAGRCATHVVAVSEAMRRFLVQDVGIPQAKVTTIYNGIDAQRYAQPLALGQLRAGLGIPPRARIIGTVGSLYPVKGQKYLLLAMAQVIQRFPNTVCLIAGRGELLPALQQLAADLHLGDRVKLLGFRSDIPELLSLLDVFVLPSLSEGLPLSLLEAQAAGKPAVASRVGGSPEVIEDGGTGYLVPPGEPDILAGRILWLLEDPSRAAAMGERGRSRVGELFSLESMGRNYLSLYMRCANGHAADVGVWAGRWN